MHCERAQEFFSDYLERALDRPLAVALETHLSTCPACRDDVEALRETLFSLEALPPVEPPANGEWQVICRLANERAARYEADRRRPAALPDWLRRLSPANMAMTAGLGTLVVAGTLWMAGVPQHVQQGFLPRGPGSQPRPEAVPTSGWSVAVGPESPAGRQVTLQLRPGTSLASPEVSINTGARRVSWSFNGVVEAGRSVAFPVQLPESTAAVVLEVDLRVPAQGEAQQVLVAVPGTDRAAGPLTVSLVQRPVAVALRELASALGRPVVLEAPSAQTVTLQADEQPARRLLESLAEQLRAEVRDEQGQYRLVPAR